MFKNILLVVAGLLAAAAAGAHPGHGTGGDVHGLTHYLVDPIHVLGILTIAVATIGGVGAYLGRRRSPVRQDVAYRMSSARRDRAV